MKKSFSALLLTIAIAFGIHSCEYQPVGEFNRTVNKDIPAPDIQVIELNLDYDTVFLYSSYSTTFSFNSSNQEIIKVKFSIDGVEKYSVNFSTGIFSFDYPVLTEGIHTLEMQLITASGTGSIAEHLGAEGFQFTKTWTLVVDKSFYNQTKGIVQNGLLKLTWPKYRNSDLKEYVVSRLNDYYGERVVKRTSESGIIDSTYVGEGADYRIKVITSNGSTINWGYLTLKPELPNLSLVQSPPNQYSLKWGLNKYYNAVDTFLISQSLNWGVTYSTIKAGTNYNDTILNLTTAFFGDNGYFRFTLVPRQHNPYYQPALYYMFQTYLETDIGFPLKELYNSIRDIRQVSKDEFIFTNGCTNLIRYSTSQNHTVDQMTYQETVCYGCNFVNMAVSSSGKYITNYFVCDFYSMLIPSGDLNNYFKRDLSGLTGGNWNPPVKVSDNGTGIVNTYDKGFYVFDYIQNSTLAYYDKKAGKIDAIDISPDGQYIFLTDDSLHLVHFNGTQFNSVWGQKKNSSPKFYEFDAVNHEQLVTWNGSVLSVKKCSDFSSRYELPLTDKGILNIDYYNNRMLTFNTGHLYVRSFLTGALIKDIPVHLDLSNWYDSCTLIDNAIVCLHGLIYFLD